MFGGEDKLLHCQKATLQLGYPYLGEGSEGHLSEVAMALQALVSLSLHNVSFLFPIFRCWHLLDRVWLECLLKVRGISVLGRACN